MKLKGKIKMSKKKWENMKKIDQKRRRNIQNTHTHNYTQHLTKKMEGIKKNVIKKCCKKIKQ